MKSETLNPKDQKKILDYYNKRMPEMLPGAKKFYDAGGLDPDSEYYADLMNAMTAREANEKTLNPEHANVTSENMNEMFLEEALENIMLERLIKELRSEGVRATPLQLRNILVEDRLANQPKQLPNKLYRGVKPSTIEHHGDPEETGFEGQDAFIKGKKYVFVSPEPSVAAGYARNARFDRSQGMTQTKPTNYGDYVYEIDTTGLDPALFSMDESSTPGEILFGPQYKYEGDIPQEDVEITDSAGNFRKIPRIQRRHFLSDLTLKDVYIKPHLISALHRKY
jgi:hypothetical protein